MATTALKEAITNYLFRLLPLAVLALCLAIFWLLSVHTQRQEEAVLREEFGFMTNKVLLNVENRLQANIQVLRGVAGLFSASANVDRHSFRAYTESLNLEDRYPGILGVGYSLLIMPRDKEKHIRQIRSDGFPDYDIKPPGARDPFTTIIYLEPFSGRNLRAFGFDMFSEPVRQAALIRSRDEALPAMTGKVILVQETETDVQAGFLLYVPVYRNQAPHDTVAERQANLVGWAYSPLRMKDMMQSLMKKQLGELGTLIDVHIYDGEVTNPGAMMFDSIGTKSNEESAFKAVKKLQIAGNTWTIRTFSLPAFDIRLHAGKGTLILKAGCAVSLLLALLTWVLTKSREKIAHAFHLSDAANRTLSESEERFRAYFELGLVGMAILSPEKRWVQVNDRLCEMLGWSREELLGKTWLELTHPEDITLNLAQYQLMLAGKIEGYGLNKRFIRKDGAIIDTKLSVRCQRRPDGSIFQIMSLIEDISERKRMEESLKDYSENLESLVKQRTSDLEVANLELEERRSQAESANRAKSSFLAAMSHELRTPLNAILGLSESLQESLLGPVTVRQNKALETITDSGHHLLALINDILDLSRIEADMLTPDMAPMSVEDVCRSCLKFISEAAARKQITVAYTQNQAPKYIVSDQRRVKQVLINLLSNAVKFNHTGSQIGLEVCGDIERREIRFTVWDKGIGIADEDRKKLFQPFVQIDNALSRNYEGTGLGLSLVKRFMELLGGEVSLESEPGQGSRFTIILPWRECGEAFPIAIPDTSNPEGPTVPASLPLPPLVLIADDSRTNSEMLTEYLEAKGYRTIVATTGAEAVSMAGEHLPDIILMDIQMPVIVGLEAIKLIRNFQPPGNKIHCIALTAMAMQGDKERCIEAGADEYLSKPISLRELTLLIEKYIAA